MAEYIEREQAINFARAAAAAAYNRDDFGAYRDLNAFIATLVFIPVADVAPVIHAHWVYNPNGTDWNLGAWECSVCKCNNHNLPANENYNPYSFVGSRYCPNCGAKMDEEG